MSFLILDGMRVPIRSGSVQEDNKDVGEFGRAFDGTALLSRRTTKRSWKMQTSVMSREDILALRVWLLSRGKYFPLNGSADASDGYQPYGTANLSYVSGKASADGMLPTFFGGNHWTDDTPGGVWKSADNDQALWLPSAVSNLVSNPSLDSATTGWTAVNGATISRVTSSIDGSSGALRIQSTTGATRGVETLLNDTFSVAPNAKSCSLYLRANDTASEGKTVQVYLTEKTSTITPVSVTLKREVWTRVFFTYLSEGGGITTGDYLEIAIPSQGSTVDVLVDQVLQEGDLTSVPSTGAFFKTTGGGSAGAMQIASSTKSPFSGSDWSQAWTFLTRVKAGNTGTLLYLENLGGWAKLTIDSTWDGTNGATADLKAKITVGGTTTTVMTYNANWASGWHDVAVVAYKSTSRGEWLLELWFDGVLRDTFDLNDFGDDLTQRPFPGLDTATKCFFGSDSSSANQWRGFLSDLIFVPARLTSTWLTAFHGATEHPGMWPYHRISGDLVAPGPINVVAEVGQFDPVESYLSGSWRTAPGRLTFTLYEV